MAAETRQAGLTADERSDIRSTVLDTRELIEDDLYRQLERYGVYEDERVDLEQLGHLDSYDIETRRKINAAIDRELEATEGDYQRSLKNYVREATKTYLNRLVALKAIEVRGLVTETLMERPEYGNRSEMLRTVDEVAGELTDQQDGGQSTALELAYTELTDEIGVIFEESEHTAINLDFAVREEVIEQLNEIDESVWESDEAMGWVYQYFGEKEREEIDDRIDEENYKVQDTDVATKTQLFTPRYIVEWMVDNSLGRLWMEMHGEDTNIDDEDNCFYLAPLEESLIDRDAKNVRDIKILDPACGSGHMLFYAFDVLYEMYLEQGDVAEKYIPREILKHNLYGIDIDPGAAQLAALSLYVKAKSEEPDVDIEQINIVSADAVLVNGEKKEEVLARAETELEGRVLEQVWRSFEHIREWGSLVRIEQRIEEIIDEELEEVRATGQTKFTDDGLAKQSSVVSYSGEAESWEQVKERLLKQVSDLAVEALEQNDPLEEMFADEIEKSVELMDIFVEKYDLVLSNPPYLGSRKMGTTVKDYIKDNFVVGRDLYTAFIQRCNEFVTKGGYVAMVTPESFMFLYSYRGIRNELLSESQIIEAAHLSGHSFAMSDRPFTIPFILRNRDPSKLSTSRFYRMTHEQEKYSQYDDKISGLNEITEFNRKNKQHDDVYVVDQNAFDEIDRSPFVYWFGDNLLQSITRNIGLKQKISSQSGIKTGNNSVFLRKYWEVSDNKIGERYRRIVRSENKTSYYDQESWLIDWKDQGEYIKQYCDEHGHQYFFGDEDRLGESALAFIEKSSNLTTREIKDGDLCSMQLYIVYPNEINIDYLNGLLNSSLCNFIVKGLNPSMDFKQNDVYRLPFKEPELHQDRIIELVQLGKKRANDKFSLIESAMQFDPDAFVDSICSDGSVHFEMDLASADISIISGIIDNMIFEEYDLSQRTIEKIYQESPNNLFDYPHIINIGELNFNEYNFYTNVSSNRYSEEECSELISDLEELRGEKIRDVSEELGISPYTVVLYRRNQDAYSRDRKKKSAGRILSYCLGLLFGRWNNLDRVSTVEDGILTFDTHFDNSIEKSIRECFDSIFDHPYERESEIEEVLNKDFTDWLQDSFFRYHHCKEYRRRGQRIPIYWQLESSEGAFSCFVYYHKMDADTFPKLRGQYIDEKLDTLQNRLEAIESELETADGDRARDLRTEKEEIQADIDDITEFRNRIDALIEEGFEPDFEAGIWENIQKVDEHDLLAVPLDKL
ncbi:BREX-1 system adenine-specific DNA-methyltransferase PglX [Salinigranum salinum]|uniref:BREX-1 system adenine-specific DNA-methyltransferase PglX n=1 Tax=Salinigranum salinum TaxID=1364937 RepID=UPI001260FA6C|nr:BREX-1 system adenine-specific DNA-methyltransferase PglX [Salinigranum salinum]